MWKTLLVSALKFLGEAVLEHALEKAKAAKAVKAAQTELEKSEK